MSGESQKSDEVRLPRVGVGYDVHRFAAKTAGRALWLGGVKIPSDQGLEGHSDADVLCHAAADAMLGALGLPDIGYYFPPEDSQWKDMPSLQILEKVRDLAAKKDATIVNIDCSLILEKPKIAPYREQMQERMAAALGIRAEQIGVKATTHEGLGSLGRAEGAAAMATACVLMKSRA